MTHITNRLLLGLVLSGTLSLSFADSPAIGMIVADGSFQVNHSQVWDNATLFSGTLIETGEASSQLQLHNGARVRLASDTRARVFDSRLVLEKGTGQVDSANYRIEASSLEISPEGDRGVARVQISNSRQVVVAAYQGTVRVANRDGVLVAKLDAGHELTFEPQDAGAAALTKLSGCAVRSNGKILLADRTTGVTVELRGAAVEQELGNEIEIAGTADLTNPAAQGASQIIYVTSVKRLAKGSCSSVKAAGAAAGGAAAGTAAGAAAGGGLSTTAVVAIVGGVAASGSLIGLAAVHDLPGQSHGKPHTSR